MEKISRTSSHKLDNLLKKIKTMTIAEYNELFEEAMEMNNANLFEFEFDLKMKFLNPKFKNLNVVSYTFDCPKHDLNFSFESDNNVNNIFVNSAREYHYQEAA